MSSTEAAPSRSCDEGMLQMLEESNAPHFGKTLTCTMLKRTERLGIPSWFIHEHGDRFHTMLSLTGPNGSSRPVMCIVRATARRPRVYLGQEWLEFAKESGFQMGDQVVFWLVAKSCFHVLVKVHAAFENLYSKDDEGSGMRDDVKILEAPQHPKETGFSSCQVNCNPAESLEPARSVRSSRRRTSHLSETEYVKYPGLSSAVRLNSRLPHFVKKLGRNHLNGKHMQMELPWAFVKEHGDKFQARVSLLGASGHLRVVSLRIATFSGIDRVHLGKGWKEFTLENGFSEGDALLFSLVELSKFDVQIFLEAGK